MLAFCCCACARAYDVVLEFLCWPLPAAAISFSDSVKKFLAEFVGFT
jgi:hypothetical protein